MNARFGHALPKAIWIALAIVTITLLMAVPRGESRPLACNMSPAGAVDGASVCCKPFLA
jgi:hypothetical protein